MRILFAASLAFSFTSFAQSVSFKDPTGDDFGPGTYTYPTDTVYTKGSYDLTDVKLQQRADKVEVTITIHSNLEDPWRMGSGFAVQNVVLFVDTGAGTRHREGLPGMNVAFADGHAWTRAVFLSPQAESRVRKELDTKAAALSKDVIVPPRVKGRGQKIVATFSAAELGSGALDSYRYQVVLGRQEGFPLGTDVLWGRVNEVAGQHRFGGGHDESCDPHVLDVLAGAAQGADSERDEQKKQLSYLCAEDGSSKKPATLVLISPKK